MKKQDAVKWINALRSGKYKQGKTYLKNTETNEFCCLGVLCEINGKLNDTEDLGYKYVKSVLGDKFGVLNNSNIQLTDLNDSGINGEMLDFNEIADIIQIEYVEGL